MKSKITITTALLIATSLSSPSFAQNIPTSPRISWQEVSSSETNTVEVNTSLGKKYYKYEYNKDQYPTATQKEIYDSSIAQNLDKDYIDIKNNESNGGALESKPNSKINDINGNFINNTNSSSSTSQGIDGGAIYQDKSSINNINGDFVGNKIIYTGSDHRARGGAISTNSSHINKIEGNFIGNVVSSTSTGINPYAHGGAIYNDKTSINTIKADFIGNIAEGQLASGGAIYNSYPANMSDPKTVIEKIEGNFIGNIAKGKTATGGAIYNHGNNNKEDVTIKQINGKFEGNQVISNQESATGGAIYNRGTLGDIYADFINNSAIGSGSSTIISSSAIKNYGNINLINGNFNSNKALSQNGNIEGGTISNMSESHIGNIISDFVSNESISSGNGIIWGGNILNGSRFQSEDTSNISNITGNFISNKTSTKDGYIYGGNIANMGAKNKISNIHANFKDNIVSNNSQSTNYGIFGGNIYNAGEITSIKGNFDNNSIYSQHEFVIGGNIYNAKNIDAITSDFTNNKIQSDRKWLYGGNIYNLGIMQNIQSNFYNNTYTASHVFGAGLYNYNTINNINSDFSNNRLTASTGYINGGAVINYNKIGNLNLNASGNNIDSNEYVLGGIIYNLKDIDTITGNFVNNTANSKTSYVLGGVVTNTGKIGNIKNSNFINNTIKGNGSSAGAAIYSSTDLTITADNGSSIFSGNKVQINGSDNYNAIYIASADINAPTNLNLNAINSGSIVFDDTITGNIYNLNITGDEYSQVIFNNSLAGINNLNLGDKTNTHLGINSNIFAKNMIAGNITPTITLDVKLDNETSKVKNGIFNVSGDIKGDYNVIVNSLNNQTFNDNSKTLTQFVKAENDDLSTSSKFTVSRVIGSPYMWDTILNAKGESKGSNWYLQMNDKSNPNYNHDNILVTPETIAGLSVSSVALTQTSNVFRNISSQTYGFNNQRKGLSSGDFLDYKPNSWVLAQVEQIHDKDNVNIKSDLNTFEAGFDIAYDLYNSLGIFGSIRQGKYEISGSADKYYSTIGSNIDADSYGGGIYYINDDNKKRIFASVYVGTQKLDASTDDKLANFDTTAFEYGLGMEYEHKVRLKNNFTLNPLVGAYYTSIDFDESTDNIGKKYSFDKLTNIEVEIGTRLTKEMSNYTCYFKPTIVKTFVDGNEVNISGLETTSTQEDKVLGRFELGGSYNFNDNISLSAWGKYTLGSDYDASALGLKLNYNW